MVETERLVHSRLLPLCPCYKRASFGVLRKMAEPKKSDHSGLLLALTGVVGVMGGAALEETIVANWVKCTRKVDEKPSEPRYRNDREME